MNLEGKEGSSAFCILLPFAVHRPEAVASPSLEVLKTRSDGAWSKLEGALVRGNEMSFKVPSMPKHSMILSILKLHQTQQTSAELLARICVFINQCHPEQGDIHSAQDYTLVCYSTQRLPSEKELPKLDFLRLKHPIKLEYGTRSSVPICSLSHWSRSDPRKGDLRAWCPPSWTPSNIPALSRIMKP